MLTVLSPAKSLDFDTPIPRVKHSTPRMLDQSEALIDVMRTKSPAEIASLMHISEDLAHLNAGRYADFIPEHTPKTSRPAVLAFSGDVYQGLKATTFDTRDFTEATKTVRILSGLYGLLRPLDLIQPHRLEMGTRLETERGRNLYQWWGLRVTDLLAQDLALSPGSPVLINLASTEYFSVVNVDALGATVVTPRFEDRDAGGTSRVVSFYAKRARGAMAAWLVRNRIRSARALLDFAEDGYVLDKTRSTPTQPIYVR